MNVYLRYVSHSERGRTFHDLFTMCWVQVVVESSPTWCRTDVPDGHKSQGQGPLRSASPGSLCTPSAPRKLLAWQAKKRRLSEVASACFSITLAMLIGHIKKQVYCVTAWCDVDLFSKPYGISNSSVPRVFAPAAHRGQAPSDGRSEPEKAEKPTQSRGATSL